MILSKDCCKRRAVVAYKPFFEAANTIGKCFEHVEEMTEKMSVKKILGRLFKFGLLAFVLAIISSAAYMGYLSIMIEKRFSSRRWQIPSKVYSDVTILYPGQKLDMTLFTKKLEKLGYKTVRHDPENKGETSISGSTIDIFLHDLNYLSREREGFPVRITLDEKVITSIVRKDNDESILILELEPEEVMMFFGADREQRQLVSITQVPQDLTNAVMAAEDSRFYQHKGIDPAGIARAIYTNLRYGSIRQGGSTITQQLAKNYFLTPERTFVRKFNELLISITLEMKYEKEDILEIYLNEIYFGQKGSVSVNGVGEASIFYFGKPVEKLALQEAAIIAGIIKAPNHYSPYVDEEKCKKRRDFVLEAMYKKEWISFAEFMDAKAKPIETVGYTVYGKKAPYFLDYLSSQLTILYPTEMLSSLGMSIYTTLDTQVQDAAEKALERGLVRLEKTYPALARKNPEEKLQGAVVVLQPKTGAILAMIGGRDYNVSQFNRVTQALRQPGSAFKPFVFLSALDKFTPASFLSNEPKTYSIDGKSWEPKNFKPTDEDRVTMRQALAESYNIATVDMAMQVGLDRIVHQAKRLHLSTPLKPYPSLALGAFEVIPLELARAYCVFAAAGTQPFPLSLKDVMDENENVLERRHMLIESLIPPEKAFIMSSLMRSVVTEGTAISMEKMGITWPVAGKTGTTNDFKDAWFVGYTPDILALVWVGFDNGDSINATGSSAALPIWVDMMKSIPHHISGDWFKVPPEVVKLVVCSETGLLAENRTCPAPMEEYFLKDMQPTEECPVHRPLGVFKKIVRGIKKLVD